MVLGAILFALLIQDSAAAAKTADTVPATPGAMPASSTADSAVAPKRDNASLDARAMPAWALPAASDTQPRRRRHAVEYSDWYYRRLQVHRWGSWLELPVFGT